MVFNHIFFVDVGDIGSNYRGQRQYIGGIILPSLFFDKSVCNAKKVWGMDPKRKEGVSIIFVFTFQIPIFFTSRRTIRII
jgi:hypothetical protein